MDSFATPIIPKDQIFFHNDKNTLISWENNFDKNLDFKAIAGFCALGFMLDDATFFHNIKVCKPASKYDLNKKNEIINRKEIWQWNYNPSDASFQEHLDRFTNIFEDIIKFQTKGKKILVPISGGLDSRTLFIPLKKHKDITLASYEFENGFKESYCGYELSDIFNIPFYTQKITNGYIWHKLYDIAGLNNCFTDFTHPRQIAVLKSWENLGNTILLGHWGDVLFDKQAGSDDISYDEQLIQLKKKILKSGGIELAEDLWKSWDIEGSFESYITDSMDRLYSGINIDHPSARMRAFKSLYWAPRWTSINLSIFKELGELVLPYYEDKMCQFICTVPERYLRGRKIQIEYIKQHCSDAARIPWQKYYPLNLNQYHWFNHPAYFPVRAMRKVNRILQVYLSKSPELITRNWELQFLGEQNFIQLRKNLLERNNFKKMIPQNIIKKYLDNFQIDPIKYAHPVSMLLTLAVFADKYYSE